MTSVGSILFRMRRCLHQALSSSPLEPIAASYISAMTALRSTGPATLFSNRIRKVESGIYSASFDTDIDIQDEYFTQDGFTYTGLLLGAIQHPPGYVVQQRVDDCGNEEMSNNLQSNMEFGNRKQSNEESSTTFEKQLDEDPWNLSMFDDIQLDQVLIQKEPKCMHIYDAAPVDKRDQKDEQDRSMDNEDNTDQQREITEEDINIFLNNEKLEAEGVKQDENAENETVNILKPEVGMEFGTREEAQKFFNLYAYNDGFSVSIVSSYRTASKKRNNEVIRFTMKCNKYGRNTEAESEQIVAQRQSTVIAKSNCKVEMVVSEKNGLWKITGLHLQHNHALCPQSRFYRSHIYMSDGEKEMIKTMKHCNMPTRDMVAVLAFIRGGMTQLPYNKRKVSNYSSSINREVTNNDMMEVLDCAAPEDDVAREVAGASGDWAGTPRPVGHQLFLADEEARQGGPRPRGRRPRPRAPIRAEALLWSWPCFALAKYLRRLQLMTMPAPPTMVGWIRPPRPLLCPPRPASTSAAAAADLAVASWQQRRQSAVQRIAPRRLASSLVVSSPARLLLLLRADRTIAQQIINYFVPLDVFVIVCSKCYLSRMKKPQDEAGVQRLHVCPPQAIEV
ncbi:hypothetical protein QYE76_062615 [Lolium multiflorum]|uniref:FAR1 domain-containing protein n=1 Tax=Lolium multiflorum TaxID=4521 RepID=A0AAD8W7F0_LOLMU|nr:hypothetical protein QYE76_062615 [Lolium multiflorum]